MEKSGLNRFDVLRVISSALGTFASFLLLILLGLTVADVVSRNFFGSSILGMIEISTLLMVGVAFFGLAQAEVDGRNVSLGLLEERLAPKNRLVLSWVRMAVIVLLGSVMVWGMTNAVFSAVVRGEATNDVLALPTWPAKLAVLLSFAAFLLVAIAREVLWAKNNKTRSGDSYENVYA